MARLADWRGEVLGSDVGWGAANAYGVVSGCAFSSLLVSCLMLAISSASSHRPQSDACWVPTPSSDVCSFDMLTFYYDEDGELQCECLDDTDDEDWCLVRGFA